MSRGNKVLNNILCLKNKFTAGKYFGLARSNKIKYKKRDELRQTLALSLSISRIAIFLKKKVDYVQ